jgi:Tol biopolymer transport system component
MRSLQRGLSLAGICLGLVTLWLGLLRQQPAQPAWIYFVSTRDANAEIYRMRPDGSQAVNVTQNRALDAAPLLSPDGTWLAFTSRRDGNLDLYKQGLFGQRVVNLTQRLQEDTYSVTWSPDGQWIAYIWEGILRTGEGPVPISDIFRLRNDGRQRQILNSASVKHYTPRFSPDGDWLLYGSERDGNPELYRARLDGVDSTERLTNHPGDDVSAHYSPDGAWIVFTSTRDGNPEVYRMRADGSDLLNLTQRPSFDGFPLWSPDGQWIAFLSTRNGNEEVYRIRPDGSDLLNLSNDPNDNARHTWSPDSQWLAYDDGDRIWRVRLDGTQRQALMPRFSDSTTPSYSPIYDLPWRWAWNGLLALALLLLSITKIPVAQNQ